MQCYKIAQVTESLLKIMSYFGGWRPKFCTSLWAIRIYTLYSVVVILNFFFFGLSFIIIVFKNKDKTGTLTQNIFISTSFFLLSFKLSYFNIRRQDVNTLLNLFLQKHCLPCDRDEIGIFKKLQFKERLVV